MLQEDMAPPMQHNDYAVSKWVSEIQCNNFRKQWNNKILVLRFFNSYGPGEYYTPYRSVVCQFIYRMLHDLPITVYQGYHRVFMYIGDFIPTLANAADHGCFEHVEGDTINIGGEEYRSVVDLFNVVKSFIPDTKSEVVFLPEDEHNVVNKRPDISAAREKLLHNPTTLLEEGIRKTVEWMKSVY